MTEVIVSSMPMMVCGVISMQIALSLYTQWSQAKMRLLIFMVTATLLYMAHCIYFNRQMDVVPLTDALYSFCNPAVFPLYYLYIEELTAYNPNRRRQVYCLLPSVLCFLAVSTLYLLMDSKDTDAFVLGYLYADDFSSLSGLAMWQGVAHALMKVVFAIQIPIVLFFGLRRIKDFNAVVDSNYSNVEGKRILGAKTLLVLFALTSFLAFVFNLIGRERFSDGPDLLFIPALLFSFLLLLIGHVGLVQQFSVRDIEVEAFESSLPVPEEHSSSDLLERIKKLVIDEKLYLCPNLKVTDLASRLDSNRYFIYHAINVEMGVTFSNYINGLRIDHASELLKEHPELPINEVVMKCGFTSTSAFYRNFKRFKGITPQRKRASDLLTSK